MEKNNTLKFDLNEIVSEQIAQKLNEKQEEIKSQKGLIYDLEQTIRQKDSEIKKLNQVIQNSESSLFLFNRLREDFSKIQATPESSNNFARTIKQNQYFFIEKILKEFFGINSTYKLDIRDCPLEVGLAIQFYNNKEIVCQIVKLLISDHDKIINFIMSFKMPFDYNKDVVLKFAQGPEYNTNGYHFGVSRYWVEYRAGLKNVPHDLMLKNPFILEGDVFSALKETIKHRRGQWSSLLALPDYNKNITDEQIVELGQTLPYLLPKFEKDEKVSHFINKYIKKLDKETLDFLFQFISVNQFSIFHWKNFPVEYQKDFLRRFNINDILNLFSERESGWTLEQKEEFLKEYFKEK